MKVTLLQIGKTKEQYLKEGIDEYVRRLSRYLPFQLHTLPDVKLSNKADRKLVKDQEGAAFLQKIKAGDYVVLLDEKGKSFSSVEFANYLLDRERMTGHIIFVIGGAFGFSEEIYKRANSKISLSKMTFSHQMVRLIFVEQLYRAYTIRKGEPYHHV